MCARAYSPATSSLEPATSTIPSFDQLEIVSIGMAAGFSSTGPTSRMRIAVPRSRKSLAASTSSPIPLSHNMRETHTATGTPSGSGAGWYCSISTPEPLIIVMRSGEIPIVLVNSAKSSGFWTITRLVGRLSKKRNATRTIGRTARANNPSEMNRKPIPANAFIMLGIPVSQEAIDPYKAGFKAT